MVNVSKATVILAGTLAIVACGKERPAESIGTTTTTRGEQRQRPAATVEEVRTVLVEKRPGDAATIEELDIRAEGGIVTLRGRVDDEATHSDLVNRVRSMPNVRAVRDEIRVAPKGAPLPGERRRAPGAGEPEGQLRQHQQGQTTPIADAVRRSMHQVRPMASPAIEALTITEVEKTVTVKGKVPDEPTRRALLRAARETHDVKSVKDDLEVEKPNKE